MNKIKAKESLQSKDIIRLKQVTKKDMEFLYEFLKEREPNENISHKKIPTFNEHKKFVLSKPYQKWYIVLLNNEKIGTIYLSIINEIGLHFKKKYQTNILRNKVLHELIEKNQKNRYLVNINPRNKSLISFYKSKKFKKIQHTYELIKRV
jgi:hypothetical protein